MHYGSEHDGWGGGSWWWMAVMMIVFWGGLVWIALTLIRRGNHGPLPQTAAPTPHAPTRQTPQEILAERLARGEIEPDDYHQRLDTLQRSQGRPDAEG